MSQILPFAAQKTKIHLVIVGPMLCGIMLVLLTAAWALKNVDMGKESLP